MPYAIDQDECTGCGKCPPVCPIGAIIGGQGYYEIDAETCNNCSGLSKGPLCVAKCPIEGAIYLIESL